MHKLKSIKISDDRPLFSRYKTGLMTVVNFIARIMFVFFEKFILHLYFVDLDAVFSALYLDKENYQRNQSSPRYLVLYVN